MPLSRTASRTCSSDSVSSTDTRPSKVNFNAFESRLRTIVSHIARSTNTGPESGATSTWNSSPARWNAERNELARSAVSCVRSVGSNEAAMRPASMREKSSRAFTSFSSRRPLRYTVSRLSPDSAPAGEAIASSVGPSNSVSGVRNSWLTFEKNAVLARSISASASARRRSSS